MEPFRHILVATAFDDGSKRALDLALLLATQSAARLTILHVTEPPPQAFAMYSEGMSWPSDELHEHASKQLGVLVEEATKKYWRITGLVAPGVPWEIIRETSRYDSIDLVVMGTHGRRGMNRLFLGSVAEKVVRTALVSVLTVPLHSAAEA